MTNLKRFLWKTKGGEVYNQLRPEFLDDEIQQLINYLNTAKVDEKYGIHAEMRYIVSPEESPVDLYKKGIASTAMVYD